MSRIRAYIAACAAVAGVLVYWAIAEADHFDVVAVITFGVLSLLAEQYPVKVAASGASYSVSFVFAIAAIIAAGPAEASIAILFATIEIRQARNRPLHRHVFNAAQLSASAAAAGLIYVGLGGPVGQTAGLLPDALLPLVGCTAVTFLVNTALVAGALALSESGTLGGVWRRVYAGLSRTYVAFALLGLLLGVLYLQMGWPAVAFFLLPLLVARSAFQAAIEMQGAYDDTVRSLVSAIEAKDPYTRGHAERVARLAEMVARVYGLSEERCRAIRYAALMHDVGKLGVLNSILQKPGKLTPEEYEHMKQHPLRGVEIVGEIDLLEEAIVAVRHHHERLDGQGYPDGLRGAQIPLFARIITVADAFDSMTSTRTYRRAMTIEQGLGELHRCEGTQFDPRAIEALEQALERFGWTPAPEPRDEEPPKDVKDARAASL